MSRRRRGQSIEEYGLLMAAVALVVLVGVHAFGQEVLAWLIPLAGRITTVGT